LATLVRDLPGDHPSRQEVTEKAKDFFLAVLSYQDGDHFIKGLKGLRSFVGEDGSVSHASRSLLCPGDGTKEDYMNFRWALNDPHSFGPVVLAFTQAANISTEKLIDP